MPKRQFTTPILIQDGAEQRLHRVPLREKDLNEAWLQDLLFKHPGLIPGEELDPAFERLIPVCRELPVGGGFLDLLYVNRYGSLALVESKLWRNSQARREVVGQIIDYAQAMAQWTYDDLVGAINKANASKGGDPLCELLNDNDEEHDVVEFQDAVSRNLQLGRFLLLIVGDGIQESVEQMVDYLQAAPRLQFTLGLVELGLYRLHEGKNDPLLVQPRLVVRTKEVTRAVVEIKGTVDPVSVSVSIPAEESKKSGTGRRPSISEQEFFEALDKLGDQDAIEVARWAIDNAKAHGLEVKWGAGGPLIKWRYEDGNESYTFGQLDRSGTIGETHRLFNRCVRNQVPAAIPRAYHDKLASFIPGAVRRELKTQSGDVRDHVVQGENGRAHDWPSFAPLANHKEEWFEAIKETAKTIQQLLGDRSSD